MKVSGQPASKLGDPLVARLDNGSERGRLALGRCGWGALHLTGEILGSPSSIVLGQADHRLHTINAAMVASLGT